ncbi:MAG: hypothetical protein PSV23_10045 [Brevundimonas sp.]|uniref:hypothetical protein n=1 Tax=Brevundimonas sp. TaxID=1871086 RepID=UPI0024871EB7|nr:hypothetical protein [Brevundimonas sp.]MDI1327124.1 hypothetical protein [Brevundimonas sp.]
MDSWKTTALWLLAAAGLALMTLSGLAAHGLPFIPALLCVIAAACALHAPTRGQVMDKLLRAFSGSAVRSVLIVVGALMLIQLLPLEMALLLAGDVLVYLEAVMAISLLAAGTRLRPMRAAIVARAAEVMTRLTARRRDAVRAIRAPRPGGRRRPAPDDSDGAWAFA